MTEPTRLYIWRSRARGLLIVTAKSLEDAHLVIAEKAPRWERYARTHDPQTAGMARAGEVITIAQR